jgi:hypothetical protein
MKGCEQIDLLMMLAIGFFLGVIGRMLAEMHQWATK